MQYAFVYLHGKKSIGNISHRETISCSIVLTGLDIEIYRKHVRLLPPSCFSRDLIYVAHVTNVIPARKSKDEMVTPTPDIEVVNTSVFPDEEFIRAAKQVNDPDFTGYEFYVETMGVTFYRKYREARVTLQIKRSMILSFIELRLVRVQGARNNGPGPDSMW